MSVEFIAYKGMKFIIEWYYNCQGKSNAYDFYCRLSMQEKIKLLRLFKRIGDDGKIKDKTKFNYEGNQIFAFKPQPQRFLCFFYEGKKIIVTNGFDKKQQKLPKNEKNRALPNKKDYEHRVIIGQYYE